MAKTSMTTVAAAGEEPGGRTPDGRVAALDGIRAFAVCAVLAFHGGVTWAPGGFLGVDAFFVLSGYLITSTLLREWQRTGRIDVWAFYGRRVRRLLPPLLLVVATVSVAAKGVLPAADVRLLRGDAVASLFYVANWRMLWRGSGYFAQTAVPSPLQHTWSLGIEEQFYLCWPLALVALLLSRPSRRLLLVVCGAGVVGSTLLMAMLARSTDPARVYFGTDTRAASLLIGAGLAALLHTTRPAHGAGPGDARPLVSRRRRSLLGASALVGVTYVAWLWTHVDGDDLRLYQGGMTAAALAVAAVIAHVVLVPDGPTARALSLPPLPALGTISYGIYLWHWPVFLAANAGRTGLEGANLFALRCLLTTAVAAVSYVLVERPIRLGASSVRPPVLVGCTAGAVAAVLGVALMATSVPSPASSPTAGPGARAVDAGDRDGIDDVERSGHTIPAAGSNETTRRGHLQRRPPAHHRRTGQPVVVDVLGDSVAWSLVTYLPSHPGLDVRDRTMLGCGITLAGPFRYYGQTFRAVPTKCRHWRRLWREAIAADNPDVALILVGRWETMDRKLDGRWSHIGDRGFNSYLRARLDEAIALAGALGAHVILATEPYNRRGEQLDGSLFPEDQPTRVSAWNQLLRGQAKAHPGVDVVELGARVSPRGRYTDTAGGIRVRADGLHLTPAGVRDWVAPWLFPRLLAAAPA